MNIGILAPGVIAKKMAATLAEMSKKDDVRCLAVGSRDLEKAKAFAEEYDIERAYGSYEELAADKDIDLIYISSPHSHHYAHAMLCLNAGKSILVEKSFTGNARQAKEVIKLAKENNLLCAEAIWTRYLPMRKKLDEILASGVIGKIHKLKANLGYNKLHVERMYNPALAGGALLDVGVYVINFALMAFGDDIENICSSAQLADTGVDKFADIKITFKDGKIAELYASCVEKTDRKGFIKGDKGFIEFENINNCEWIEVNTDGGKLQHFDPPAQITGFEYQVEACLRAWKAGEVECPEMPHGEIIKVMEIMDGLRKEWGVVYPFDHS
ncbi:MAG: Gfo/Idh/MocA family oxidoreductase [Eubacterium sp.]|jgi:predicted dehydrogenase|nr:Gfo/Idh/MocA family oxidoreductase [Eubacterium sp.]